MYNNNIIFTRQLFIRFLIRNLIFVNSKNGGNIEFITTNKRRFDLIDEVDEYYFAAMNDDKTTKKIVK